METQIKVNRAKPNARPSLKALADVTLAWGKGQITVRRFAVFQKNGEPSWASFPRLQLEENGKKDYFPLNEFPSGLRGLGLPKKQTLDQFAVSDIS